MFLEGIARNTYEVVAPWKRYKPLGNSLFGFRLIMAAIGLALMLLIVGAAALIALPDIRAERFGGAAITALVVGLGLLLPTAIFLSLIDWVTTTFVTRGGGAGGGRMRDVLRRVPAVPE
jgi:hypothetical protein